MKASTWAAVALVTGVALYVNVPEARAAGDQLGRRVLSMAGSSTRSSGTPLALPHDLPRAVTAARAARARYGVPVSVALGQAMLESGTDLRSGLARGHRNYFGVKCTADNGPYASGCATMPTVDYAPGRGLYRNPGARFRTYPTPEASFLDYGRVLTLPRYRAAHRCGGDPACFIRAVAAGGYATPTYATSVLRVIDAHNLRRYDR